MSVRYEMFLKGEFYSLAHVCDLKVASFCYVYILQNNQLLTFFIDVYTDAALITVRLHSTIAIDDCLILVLSEYRNLTSEKNPENFNKTDTNGNGGVNK